MKEYVENCSIYSLESYKALLLSPYLLYLCTYILVVLKCLYQEN